MKEYIELDPEGLHPRTELSKIYQQQKKWKEAEDILKEALAIETDNYIILTESALLYKRWAKAIDSKEEKTVLRRFYIEAVIKSIYANNENIPILMEAALLFKQRRQYRAALLFLDKIRVMDNDDLENLREQELIYSYMSNHTKAEECRRTGEEVIKKNSYVKFRNRFEEQIIKIDLHKTLIADYQIGKYRYIYATRERFVQDTNGNRINIFEDGNVCKTLRNNDEIYFSIYTLSGETKADCIEPFFSNMESVLSKLNSFK